MSTGGSGDLLLRGRGQRLELLQGLLSRITKVGVLTLRFGNEVAQLIGQKSGAHDSFKR